MYMLRGHFWYAFFSLKSTIKAISNFKAKRHCNISRLLIGIVEETLRNSDGRHPSVKYVSNVSTHIWYVAKLEQIMQIMVKTDFCFLS